MKRRPRSGGARISLFVWVALAAVSATHVRAEVIDAAGAPNTSVLAFRITEGNGPTIPGRLTFVREGGAASGDQQDKVFANVLAAPDALAIRDNVVYTASGQGEITVPVGRYRVYASRGMEWSVHTQTLTFVAGKTVKFDAPLKHEVDTTGFVGGDFHLHTLTHSGHGDASVSERVITLMGEGVEFAVATDHNHNTDYGPELARAHGHKHVKTVVGNEVSTPIGHFNTFPLNAGDKLTGAGQTNARTLFKLLRKQKNAEGIVPIIQVNHPRAMGLDYFTKTGLDPITGISKMPAFSDDFDSLEVFNENEGWGYYDNTDPSTPDPGINRHWVLGDWFNFLNQGKRYAAVGNSDSHHVIAELAGIPRNYVVSETDDPAQISTASIAAGIRKRALVTTTGPFLRYWVNDVPMGGDVKSGGDNVKVTIDVRAASWVAVDRIKIIVNGDVRRTIEVQESQAPQRLHREESLSLSGDSWIVVVAEGDRPMAPALDGTRPILPLAVANPVWVDADGDGKFTPPAARIARAFARTPVDGFARLVPADKMLFLFHLATGKRPHGWKPADVARVLSEAFLDENRRVRIAAAHAANKRRDRQLIPALETLATASKNDIYLRVLALDAIRSIRGEGIDTLLVPLVADISANDLGRYAADVIAAATGQSLPAWRVLRFFPNPDPGGLKTNHGPEAVAGRAAAEAGRNWITLHTDPKGYLDLGVPDDTDQHAIAYAETHVHSDADENVVYATGSNDGSQLYVNDGVILEDPDRHGASPTMHTRIMRLRKGWNRILYKVENDVGDMGFYLKLFTQKKLKVAPEPPRTQ